MHVVPSFDNPKNGYYTHLIDKRGLKSKNFD